MMANNIGVLLVNLGTPKAPNPAAVRKYLREFLSDPRIVELPRLFWLPILYGIILPLRAKRSAALYQKVWLPEGSPLLIYSQKLINALQDQFHNDKHKVFFALGMRYGEPSIKQALLQLQQKACDKIIVLPLFPQYSAAATASVFDAISNELQKWRVIPTLHFIKEYYTEPLYSQAIAHSIQQHWKQQKQQDYLLFSFHGLPQRCVDLGDPYQQQCQQTALTIANQLGLSPTQYKVVFQSRFGYAQWLQPYCDKTLAALPMQGIKNVSIVCPGFAVDCLETLEEINQLNRNLFLTAGGESFTYIPALNDSEIQIRLLKKIIMDCI